MLKWFNGKVDLIDVLVALVVLAVLIGISMGVGVMHVTLPTPHPGSLLTRSSHRRTVPKRSRHR